MKRSSCGFDSVCCCSVAMQGKGGWQVYKKVSAVQHGCLVVKIYMIFANVGILDVKIHLHATNHQLNSTPPLFKSQQVHVGCVLLPLACTLHQATLRKSACQPRQQATHPPVASARCALSAVNQPCHPKTLQHDAHRRQCEGELARPASISLSQAHTLC